MYRCITLVGIKALDDSVVAIEILQLLGETAQDNHVYHNNITTYNNVIIPLYYTILHGIT